MTDSKVFEMIEGLKKRVKALDGKGFCAIYQQPTSITMDVWVYGVRFGCKGRVIRFDRHPTVVACADDAWLVGKALDALEEEAK